MLPTLPIPMIGALILGFLCVSLIASQKRLSALAGLIALCAVQSALIALIWHYGWEQMRLVQPVVACCIPPLAWIALTRLGLERGSRWNWMHLAAPIIAVVALMVQPYLLDALIPLLYFGYGLAILYATARGADALPHLRLESGDQSGRIWRWIAFALIASGLCDLAIVGAIIAGHPQAQLWIVSIASSGVLLLLGVLGLSRSLSDLPEVREPIKVSVDLEMRAEDAEIMARLDRLMDEGALYLDPDLTLGRLARRLGLPVKTLSATINRVSGENVSRYINARRIKEACRSLQSGDSVTQAMLNAGFNTKSNFNREFLRVTGQTPRAYKG